MPPSTFNAAGAQHVPPLPIPKPVKRVLFWVFLALFLPLYLFQIATDCMSEFVARHPRRYGPIVIAVLAVECGAVAHAYYNHGPTTFRAIILELINAYGAWFKFLRWVLELLGSGFRSCIDFLNSNLWETTTLLLVVCTVAAVREWYQRRLDRKREVEMAVRREAVRRHFREMREEDVGDEEVQQFEELEGVEVVEGEVVMEPGWDEAFG